LTAVAENSGFTDDEFETFRYEGFQAGKHKFRVLSFNDNEDLWMVSFVFVYLGKADLELDYAGVPAFEGSEEEAEEFFDRVRN
jgi:hypothetical protein